MAAWNAYSIPGQPAGILLDRQGRERGRWLGAFDPADVLAAARALYPAAARAGTSRGTTRT